MNHPKIVALLLGAATLALAACGGRLTPAVPPSAADGVGSLADASVTFPTKNGSTYTYTDANWGLRTFPGSAPQPQPTSTYPDTATVVTGAKFGSRENLTEFAHETSTALVTRESNEYFSWKTGASGKQFVVVGATGHSKSTPSNASPYTLQSTVTYSRPFVEFEYPFGAGHTWSGAAAYHELYDESIVLDGKPTSVIDSETWNAAGSYTASYDQRAKDGSSEFLSGYNVASDGSATITSETTGSQSSKTSIGVPQKLASGKYVIPFASTGVTATTIPDWYPGGKLPPSPLDQATTTDRGLVPIPRSCHVPASVATKAEFVEAKDSQLDPTGGITTDVDQSYYANGIGLVCDDYISIERVYNVFPPKAELYATYTQGSLMSLDSYAVAKALRKLGPSAAALQDASAGIAATAARQRERVRTERQLRRFSTTRFTTAIAFKLRGKPM